MNSPLSFLVLSFLLSASFQVYSKSLGDLKIPMAASDPTFKASKQTPSIFYIDPEKGNISNSGSKKSPWNTLEAVIKKGYIETKDKSGKLITRGAPVKSGDTIKLMTGYHGKIYYKNSYNDDLITIEAEEGETPTLSRLEIHSATNLLFKGLTISPSFNNEISGRIVHFCTDTWFGACNNITLMDSYIYTVKLTNTWTKEEWVSNASDGIHVGNGGIRINIINNMLLNTKFGITMGAESGTVNGNVVSNFSADGIRVGANNTVIQFNVIKNNYNVDGNHDDGIQGYGGGHGDSIINNIVIEKEDPFLKHTGPLQGIVYFDGLLTNISIIGNTVDVSKYHGISLYDTELSLIADNVVYTSEPSDEKKSWIMIGSKGKIGSKNNILISNKADSFNLTADNDGFGSNNENASKSDYSAKFFDILSKIHKRYGRYSVGDKKLRVSNDYMDKL